MKLRVMFVDDDLDVLEGLENRLRPMRDRWAMSFVQGADTALRQIISDPIDAIVAEARMRVMPGVTLLAHAREMHPKAIRIILSGKTDVDGLFGGPTLSIVHQVLAKPCEAEVIERAITRAHSQHGLLSHPGVQSAIASIEGLPTMPAVYTALSQMLDDPRVGNEAIAALIESDASITARVMQVANSAYFGRGKPTPSVRDALSRMGIDIVRGLVLSSEMFGMFERGKTSRFFSLGEVSTHALRTARMAAKLAEIQTTTRHLARTAFTAGVLHDVGIMVMATALPDMFESALRFAMAEGIPFHEAEERLLNFTHAEIGAYLLAIWGLPEATVEAVAFHHRPRLASASGAPLVELLHIADYVTHLIASPGDATRTPTFDPKKPIDDSDISRLRKIAAEFEGITV